jgi:hypothetical protein
VKPKLLAKLALQSTSSPTGEAEYEWEGLEEDFLVKVINVGVRHA